MAEGDKIEAINDDGEWVQVEFSDGEIGYVKSEYVTVQEALDCGESIEQIKEREDALKKEKEEARKNRSKVCKVCGFEGHNSLFKKNTRTCKKCYAAKMRKYREEHPEKRYGERTSSKCQKYNHAYYLAHKEESLERTRRNRAKKKECT